VWRYISVWLLNAAIAVIATAAEVPKPETPADGGLIKATYDWATTIAGMTDRALWLFFLGVILLGTWWNDRRKEKELSQYRARDAQLVAALTTNNDRLAEANKLMERIERWMDDH
jgi:hypothetical protein